MMFDTIESSYCRGLLSSIYTPLNLFLPTGNSIQSISFKPNHGPSQSGNSSMVRDSLETSKLNLYLILLKTDKSRK